MRAGKGTITKIVFRFLRNYSAVLISCLLHPAFDKIVMIQAKKKNKAHSSRLVLSVRSLLSAPSFLSQQQCRCQRYHYSLAYDPSYKILAIVFPFRAPSQLVH